MSVLNQLASALERRDEVPNLELAQKIADSDNQSAVAELIAAISHKSKDIRHDAIKVLYEAGRLKPELIANHLEEFKKLLTSKDNRMQWGGMTALQTIAGVCPNEIYDVLPELNDAADRGSVITRDQYVALLIQLIQHHTKGKELFPLVIEQLQSCPDNQLPMYAEQALPVVPENEKASFRDVLQSRIEGLEKASKKVRIEKVLKKLAK